MDIKQYLEKNKRSSLAQPKKNFTLVELAVVITTIGTLAAIVIPNATNKVADARVSALKQDIAHIEQALMQHEIENPEVPVLSKVEASELGSKLKSTVEKELNDDASDVYRIDMKVLKDYLHKTKYGHLDDDAKEDEYFFSKKTNRVYYEKGYSTSKGYRVHYLGSGNAKMQSAIKQLSPVKIITTLPVTYYLLENGDLYAEGYNYYGMMMQDKDLMFDGPYSGAKRLPLQKIASDVVQVRVPGVYDTSGQRINHIAYEKKNGDWILIKANEDDVNGEKKGVYKEKTLSDVKEVVLRGSYNTIIVKDDGAVEYLDSDGDVYITANGVNEMIEGTNLARMKDGRVLNLDVLYVTNRPEEVSFGILSSADPNKGKPFEYVRTLPNGMYLVKAGTSYYAANPDEMISPIPSSPENFQDSAGYGEYIYKDDNDNLFNQNGTLIAENVESAFYWGNVIAYKKGDELFINNKNGQNEMNFFDVTPSFGMPDGERFKIKSYSVKNSGPNVTPYVVLMDDKNNLYSSKIFEEYIPLAKNVESFKYSDVEGMPDSVIIKTKDGKTFSGILTSNSWDDRFNVNRSTEIMNEK